MMKVVVGVLTFIGFVIAASTAHAQTIKGKVVDTLQQPIPYMNVLLLHHVDKRILSFQQTDINGRFSVVIPEGYSSNNYFLSMSALGYKRDTVLFSQADIAVDLTIEAQPDAIALQSVEVKGALPKISLKGDTIDYHVKGFSDNYDRTIGDVLSKMPGIKVEDNGRIFYNGQAISKLYIDGDDVLEDKYSIGTRSIPHRVVEKVHCRTRNDQYTVLTVGDKQRH